MELQSPLFLFRVDTANGLRARSWENRLTGQTVNLGDGPEVQIDIGLPDRPLQTPSLEVSGAQTRNEAGANEVVFTLSAKEPALSVLVTYRWDAQQPVLHKFVRITNKSDHDLNHLLNVRLGTYRTEAKVAERGRGFPAYLNEEFFLGLAHPAGSAQGMPGGVSLRQQPGIKLAPGKSFECMEAVYGVAGRGEARKGFIAHLRSRMRRVVRGHDHPYAIYDNFGTWPWQPGDYTYDNFGNSEAYVLHNLHDVAASRKATGCRFDLCSVDFWVDYHGDLKRFDPVRFPNGLTKIRAELAKLGIVPGLWIDSGGWLDGVWTIGGNPAVKDCFSEEGGKGILCRATEPIKSLYTEAFLHHIRENGVRLLKFDDFVSTCANPRHEHLPGLYSTEPIVNAMIEFLRALDAECPEVFVMLYWGYDSPWWLLHGDTIFDAGLKIEASSVGELPTPFARDGVTQTLDQAQWRANENHPALGKDSLGIWLSDWPWNSQIGPEHWQGGFIMDICRGSMLAQMWGDLSRLPPAEQRQMADFIALLKTQPGCFGNSRFILGDPFKNEPYGYCCTDGRRAFLALHNLGWKDSLLSLELNPAWGLPDGQDWDLYRWHPDPARLQGEGTSFRRKASIALRPFEIVLLEVVAHGRPASLDRQFEPKPIPISFAEASLPLELGVTRNDLAREDRSAVSWTVLAPAEMTSLGGATLTRLKDESILAGGKNPTSDTYIITAHTDLTGITAIRLETLTDPSLPMLGPGRRVGSGNFALTGFRLAARPRGSAAAAAPVELHHGVADFPPDERHSADRAIDGNPKTGWWIHPRECLSHAAIFHVRQPFGFSNGTTLQFTLDQGLLEGNPEHNLGRLRLSVTSAKPPFPPPKAAEPTAVFTLQGQVPASRKGGVLVISVETAMKDSTPIRLGPSRFFSAQAELAGRAVACRPALGMECSSAWQIWRIAAAPSANSRPLEMKVTTLLSDDVKIRWSGFFIPE